MHWLTALLTWLSADPAVVNQCAARAAAAVECAYSSMVREPVVEEKRPEVKPQKGETCPDGKCPLPRR